MWRFEIVLSPLSAVMVNQSLEEEEEEECAYELDLQTIYREMRDF